MNQLSEILNINENTPSKECQRGEILQRAGDEVIKMFFVKEGLLRSYTIDEKGKEHNFMFASEGWIISDIESMEFKEPALLFIEAVEPSVVVQLNPLQVMESSFQNMDLKELIVPLFKRVAVMQRRIILLMSAPAKQRYLHFIESYPQLPNRLPQRMIASYLGITPEALSKIRGEMARNK